MKKIRICGLFPIFLVALLAVASCETDKPDFSSAEVSIELVSVTETTAEFKLSLLNAETAYWMISTESDKHPDARSIKDGGTEYDAEAGYAAVENLVPGSQYIFWAVAENDNVLGKVSSYEFKTIDEESEDVIKVEATTGMGVYYGNTFSSSAANYYFMLSDCKFSGSNAVTEGMMLYFDCFAGNSDTPQDAKIPSGTYEYVNDDVFEPFKINKESTVFVGVDADGQISSNLYPVSGHLDVVYTEGDGYTMDGSFVLQDGREIRVSYSGDFTLSNQSGVFGEDMTINAEYSYNAVYYGDMYGSGANEYYFQIGTMLPADGGGTPVGSGYYFDIDLWGLESADKDNAVIPEGTYTYSEMIDLEVAHSDRTAGHCVIPDGTARYLIPFTAGTVDVRHTAEGYDILCEFTLEDGYKLRINYTGPIDFDNQAPVESDDLDITFMSGSGIYYGDIYGAGTANYTLEFLNEEETTKLTIDVNDVLDDDMVLSEGIYTVDLDGSMEAGKFYTGIIDWLGPVGTFVTLNNNTDNPEYLLINGGTFSVEHISDGYKFTFDFTTQDGTAVKGNYEGEFPIE